MRASGRSTLLMTRTTGSCRLQRLAQHEAGLRQRALAGVDEQQHAVDHGQPALDLAAEVGVTGGVDDVQDDCRLLGSPVRVFDRHVLGEDRDAFLTLEIHRVHDPLGDVLTFPESAGLPEHGVDQRGLAVVDVGDDGEVAEIRTHRHVGQRYGNRSGRAARVSSDAGNAVPGPAQDRGGRGPGTRADQPRSRQECDAAIRLLEGRAPVSPRSACRRCRRVLQARQGCRQAPSEGARLRPAGGDAAA